MQNAIKTLNNKYKGLIMNGKSDKSIGQDASSNSQQEITSTNGFANRNQYIPTSQTVHQFSWQLSNFSIVACVTSASIVVFQSPVKTMLLNLSSNGTFVPAYSGGVWGFMKALYAGTSASLSGSAVRTVYVTGAKNGKPVEESLIKEEGKKELSSAKLNYVMSMALGDILVTQIPESLSQLRKVPGLLPQDFKWYSIHNGRRLLLGGFTPRYCSGIVNFASLCLLEEEIVKLMSLQNKEAAHFIAGAFSGVAAAFFSYPFTGFKDHLMVRAKVENGLLYNANAYAAFKEFAYSLRAAPTECLKSLGTNAMKQLPLRMGLTSVIFSLVAGVGSVLGNEPLKLIVPEKYQPVSVTDTPQSFFNCVKRSNVVAIDNQLLDDKSKPSAPL